MLFDTGLAGPQFSGPRVVSPCGQNPWTTKPTFFPAPHSAGFLAAPACAQKSGAQESASR